MTLKYLLFTFCILICIPNYGQERLTIICVDTQTVDIAKPCLKIILKNNTDSILYIPYSEFNDATFCDILFEEQLVFCSRMTKKEYATYGFSLDCESLINSDGRFKPFSLMPREAKEVEINLSHDPNGLACILMTEKKNDNKFYKYKIDLNFPKKLVGNYCRQLLTGEFVSNTALVYFK